MSEDPVPVVPIDQPISKEMQELIDNSTFKVMPEEENAILNAFVAQCTDCQFYIKATTNKDGEVRFDHDCTGDEA